MIGCFIPVRLGHLFCTRRFPDVVILLAFYSLGFIRWVRTQLNLPSNTWFVFRSRSQLSWTWHKQTNAEKQIPLPSFRYPMAMKQHNLHREERKMTHCIWSFLFLCSFRTTIRRQALRSERLTSKKKVQTNITTSIFLCIFLHSAKELTYAIFEQEMESRMTLENTLIVLFRKLRFTLPVKTWLLATVVQDL